MLNLFSIRNLSLLFYAASSDELKIIVTENNLLHLPRISICKIISVLQSGILGDPGTTFFSRRILRHDIRAWPKIQNRKVLLCTIQGGATWISLRLTLTAVFLFTQIKRIVSRILTLRLRKRT